MKHFNRVDDASSSSSSPFWNTLTPPVTPRRDYFRHQLQQQSYCGLPASSTLGRNFGFSTFHPRASHLANISGFGGHNEDGHGRFRDTVRPQPDIDGPMFAEQPNDEYEYLDSFYKESSHSSGVPIKRIDYPDEEPSKNPHRRYYPPPDDSNKNDGSDFACSSTSSFPFSNKRSNSPREIVEKPPAASHKAADPCLLSGKKSDNNSKRRCFLSVAVFVIILLAAAAALIVVAYLKHRNAGGGRKSHFSQKTEAEDYRSDKFSRFEESIELTRLLASGVPKLSPGNDTEFLASLEKARRLMRPHGNTPVDAEDSESGGFGRFISSLLPDGWRFEQGSQVNDTSVSDDYRSIDPLLEPRQLLTLRVTARKVCLFEVSTSEQEQSRQDFRAGHISGAQLLFYSSLSHNGVPVHPLQFQRYIRSLGVDTDCHVVVYDRGEHIWAAYAFWIFKLYDFPRLSLLNGGLRGWRLAQRAVGDADALFQVERGPSAFAERLGTFQAMWNARVIATFDDVFANFESRPQLASAPAAIATLVDTQNEQEFEGRPVDHSSNGNARVSENLVTIYGHIRGAVNLAVERLYDFETHVWRPLEAQRKALAEAIAVDGGQPLILYDGTSLRSAMAWFSLHRLNVLDGNRRQVAIYFGSWPEWIIRAPDYLKIIPQQSGNSSQ